jgi:hypothetical protein
LQSYQRNASLFIRIFAPGKRNTFLYDLCSGILRQCLTHRRENFFAGGKTKPAFFDDGFFTNLNGKLACVAVNHLRFNAEFLLNQFCRTGSLWFIVSPCAVTNRNVFHDFDLSVPARFCFPGKMLNLST